MIHPMINLSKVKIRRTGGYDPEGPPTHDPTLQSPIERARAKDRAHPLHQGRAVVDEASFAALPDGTDVVVTWDGGNGPHKCVIRMDGFGNRRIASFKGDHGEVFARVRTMTVFEESLR